MIVIVMISMRGERGGSAKVIAALIAAAIVAGLQVPTYLLYVQLPAIGDRNRRQITMYQTACFSRVAGSGEYSCTIVLLFFFYNWIQMKVVVCIGITR